jgi:CRP-like cAMP-binding protein
MATVDATEADRDENAGKKASLALQRALNGAGAWMVTSVRDQRKCDHPLLPAEMPATVRAKVARILQDRGQEKILVEVADPKAPWHQQLEQHVARLMQQMRSQPQQFRQLLLMAASEPSADCVGKSSSSQGFVDARRAYRRLHRASMALGEEIFYLVRAFVRRSESNGVFPQDAQVVRLASLYKLELRRHVTISAVIECIHQADSCSSAVPASKVHGMNKPGFCVIKKPNNKHPQLRRQVKSAGVTSNGWGGLDAALSPRAASAPADAACRGGQSQQALDAGSASDKVKSVHAFKLQALERLLAKTWQGSKSVSMRSLQAVPVSPTKLSDDTLAQIQERVTAFLYHRSRENYPLWSEPPLSREETARHLRALVATLMTTPLFQSLTTDQLLEVARAMKWQMLDPGDTLCTRNAEIDALIVVMNGSLLSSNATESSSGPTSPLSSPGITISAPACLGELGMVRNAERWPRTLIAQSAEGAKVLTLPKLTFDALLHRFFNAGKALPPALASASSFLQPRRPSSSPAVIARRLARTFRHSLSVCRPSTAAPTAAMEANVARWHEVRDEKMRDYRAGLEAEQRAAALEALQRAMEELSSASSDEQDEAAFLHYLSSTQSPRKGPWSRHEYYPSFDPALEVPESYENPETEDEEPPQHLNESTNPPRPQTSPPQTSQAAPAEGTAEFADQLREFYRTLNARRSVMRARLASSAPSDQMVLASPERKSSSAGSAAVASEAAWWVEEEEGEQWSIPSQDGPGTSPDSALGSISAAGSPLRGRRRSASFSSQSSRRSAASSPSKESLAQPSPLKSPLQADAASPVQGSLHGNSKGEASSRDSDKVWLSGKAIAAVPESDEEASPDSPSRNQVDVDKAATFTRARKSALNVMLTRQSTATMARHSKLLDKEAAQQVLIQKHFADSSALGSPSASRPQSGHHAELSTSELSQSHSHAPLPLRADLQRRMDSVLKELNLPPKTKLDLVLKYTHADHYDQFAMAVQLWERVQGAVAWRERVMNSLWDFEMLASDPRRHFRSISTHRLREEKQRDALFSKLNQASSACLEAMDELFRSCGDSVCLGARVYRDKMKKDYTELLYEVEQERLRIIYDGVRPHVAPAADEKDGASACDRDEDESLSMGGRPSSGRTLISVRVPSAITVPRALAPLRPPTRKGNNSPRLSAPSAANNSQRGDANLSASVCGNQEQERENAGDPPPEFTLDGANADPTRTRYQLATPRESIFVPVTSLKSKQEPCSSTPESEQASRASRVTVQVQRHRQAELAALTKQLDEQQKESTLSRLNEAVAPSQTVRPPEKTFIAPAKDAQKAAARWKQQDERASLRELFEQFLPLKVTEESERALRTVHGLLDARP